MLQADFETFCTDLFKKEMEVSGTLDLHYTLLHPENYGIDAEDASLWYIPSVGAHKKQS